MAAMSTLMGSFDESMEAADGTDTRMYGTDTRMYGTDTRMCGLASLALFSAGCAVPVPAQIERPMPQTDLERLVSLAETMRTKLPFLLERLEHLSREIEDGNRNMLAVQGSFFAIKEDHRVQSCMMDEEAQVLAALWAKVQRLFLDSLRDMEAARDAVCKEITDMTSIQAAFKDRLSRDGSTRNECPICLARESTYAFVPCGHTLCEACARRVSSEYCPVCRTVSEKCMRIYLNN